jgi:LacI family transcriptional regulator
MAFLGDPGSSPDGAERWTGFVRAHRRAGLTPPAQPIPSLYREQEGYAAARAALSVSSRLTSLFCANDEIALGAYAAAQEAGLAIGPELAISGWDDIPLARHLSPPLTTVHQPMRELGVRGARILTQRITDQGSDGAASPVRAVLTTRLVIRASCGCSPSEGGTAR